MGRLTTHVLDTALGKPAAGVAIALYALPERRLIVEAVTNADGRVDAPLMSGELQPGVYELVFAAGEYLRRTGQVGDGVPFLGEIPLRFGIASPQAHYHVPLLISAHAYSTYRGS